MLSESGYQGFPIVSSLQEMYLVGYAGKAELLYAIKRAKDSLMSGNSICLFSEHPPVSDTDVTLDLRPWMDSTPFTLHPRYPMGLVLEVFKKLGLRSVLITRRGKLCGLITKKDLLHHLNCLNDPMGRYSPVGVWDRETG